MAYRIILLLATLLWVSPGQAQKAEVFLDQLTVENGLSQSQVRCVLKDNRGFMWLGTQDGLNRYDGYQMTVYKHDPFDSTSLCGDDIRSLAEDRDGFLWIGTTNGLCRFDPRTNRFLRLKKQIPLRARFSALFVNALVPDAFGSLWLGTNQGLKRLIPDGRGDYRSVSVPVGGTPDSSDEFIHSLTVGPGHALWIGSGGGLARLTMCPVKAAAETRCRVGRIPLPLPNPVVKALAVDAFGSLWIGTPEGLAHIDPSTGRLMEDGAAAAIGRKDVSALLASPGKMLWVGTYGAGISRFRLTAPGKAEFLGTIQQELFTRHELKSGSIECLYTGPSPDEDLVWIGTYGAGAHLYSRSKNTFRYWKTITDQEQSSTAGMVFSITTDRTGNLWLGTYDGLQRFNRATGASQRYRHQPGNPASLSSDRINALLETRDGTFWVGTDRGLHRFDRQTNTFRAFVLQPLEKDPMRRTGATVLSLFEDRAGNLWVGCALRLYRIAARTGAITVYEYSPKDPTSLRAYMVSSIREDRAGYLWIGTWVGLNKLDPRTGRISHFETKPEDPASLISNQVLCILHDHRNQLWICSSKGLSRLISDGKKPRFVHYTERNGLPNALVYGALEDGRGRIWVSTNYGLSCLDPQTGRFQNFAASDGPGINEFNMNAYHRSADGTLFYGGVGMAISFRPDQLVENRHRPPIVLTGFRKFDRTLNADSLMARRGRIEIRPGESFFAFAFAALDFTNPAQNQYAYQLEGFRDEWIPLGTQREISFTNLKPGEYTLKVKGSNNNGVWSDSGNGPNGILQIPITVLPPFWQTWWFMAAVLVLVAFTIWLIYTIRVRRQVRHLLELEKVKIAESERVRKLAAQDLHDEFGNTITRISMLTEIIRAQLNGRAEEVTPLLTKISDNTNRLYQGTRDFIWAINPEHDNLYEIAIRLKDFGDDIFDRTETEFRAHGITEDLRQAVLPMGASRHLIFLFKEAMSNTLKHARAPLGQLYFRTEKDRIEVIWEDTGVGLPVNEVHTGNGLLNIQSRAERIEGKVDIQTKKGGGTAIIFSLFLTQNGG